jgi:hypothetical protein
MKTAKTGEAELVEEEVDAGLLRCSRGPTYARGANGEAHHHRAAVGADAGVGSTVQGLGERMAPALHRCGSGRSRAKPASQPISKVLRDLLHAAARRRT